MTISVGDKLPDATLAAMGEDGSRKVDLSEKPRGARW